MVINEQKENKVILPNEEFQDNESCCVDLMVADNIESLECTLIGSGTSHCVNLILMQRKATHEGINTTKRKNLCSQQSENVYLHFMSMLF